MNRILVKLVDIVDVINDKLGSSKVFKCTNKKIINKSLIGIDRDIHVSSKHFVALFNTQ